MEIEDLQSDILKVLPGASAVLNRPRNSEGVYYLDICYGACSLIIEWQPGRLFVIADGKGGEDEVVPPEKLLERCLEKLGASHGFLRR